MIDLAILDEKDIRAHIDCMALLALWTKMADDLPQHPLHDPEMRDLLLDRAKALADMVRAYLSLAFAQGDTIEVETDTHQYTEEGHRKITQRVIYDLSKMDEDDFYGERDLLIEVVIDSALEDENIYSTLLRQLRGEEKHPTLPTPFRPRGISLKHG